MKVYDAPNIRNVAVVGHGGCGKTSLVSALLFDAGAVNRIGRVDEGTTVTDFDPDEIERKISLLAALAFAEWKKTKVNLIDAPGYANFLSEARAALRVAEAALVVVDAVAGVEVQTQKVWGYAEEGGLSRLIVVNRMDRDNASFERALEGIAEVLRPLRGADRDTDRRGQGVQGRRRPRRGEGAPLRRRRQRQVPDRRDSRRAARDREGLAREARRDGGGEQRGADGGVLREGHALAGAAREGPADRRDARAGCSPCCRPRRC